MSDKDSLAGFSEAAKPDLDSDDAGSFVAGPRSSLPPPRQRREAARHTFRAQPRTANAAGSQAFSTRLEFSIRPPPDLASAPENQTLPARPDSTELKVESPPSSNSDANFDTALLRERIEARHNLGSLSPSNSRSDESGISGALAGFTRVIDQRSETSLISQPNRRNRYRLPTGDNSKRQRLARLPEDSIEDGQSAVSGMFGRDVPLTTPAARDFDQDAQEADYRFGNDNVEDGGLGEDNDRAPSAIHSEIAGSEDFNGNRGTSNDSEEDNAEADVVRSSTGSEYVRPRPRDPGEPEPPVVFEVPVALMPTIDWLSVALDADGQVLEQRLEHSESESDSNESIGSLAEMIESDSDTEAESDGNADWEPKKAISATEDAESATSSASDSDSDSAAAATVSETEDSDFTPEIEVQVAGAGSRRERPKRHRIPTVKWWLGERIQYEVDGPLNTLTAIDVRRVEPEKKVYRRRRPYRRRRGPMLPRDDDEAEAQQQTVHAPVLDADGGKFRERTVARSINGLEFEPMRYADGSIMPLVSRCAIFGGTSDAPVRLYVLRIQPGAIYTYEADVNKVCTFVVWRGRCTAKMNRTDFDLQKGMACIVPPANDLYVDNGSNTGSGARGLGEDVFFFATEINARDSPELAAAMTRDAQSVVSGAATFSRLFEMDRNDDLNQGAESFVSGLHQFGRQAEEHTSGPMPHSDNGAGDMYDEGPANMIAEDDEGGAFLPDDFGEDGNEDTASVAPSIFRDLQDDVELGEIQSQPRRREFLSFQIGRGERPQSSPARIEPKTQDEGPPSFHLERGSRPSTSSAAWPPQSMHAQINPHARVRRRQEDRQMVPTKATSKNAERFSGSVDDDELEDFFAQVGAGDELDVPVDNAQFQNRYPATQPQQYMLDVLRRVRPPPNDTDTQSSS